MRSEIYKYQIIGDYLLLREITIPVDSARAAWAIIETIKFDDIDVKELVVEKKMRIFVKCLTGEIPWIELKAKGNGWGKASLLTDEAIIDLINHSNDK